MSTIHDTGTRHAEASRVLVRALMELKNWSRQLHRSFPDHSTSALWTLSLLDRAGSVRLGALAALGQVDSSVISRQVAHLEECGLVERAPDPDDGRASLLSVTDAGHRVLDEGRGQLADVLAARLGEWEAPEIEALASTLQRLLADLGTDTSRHQEDFS